MPRFLLAEKEGCFGIVAGDEAHHILRVHRHKLGDTIAVSYGAQSFAAKIVAITESGIKVSLQEEVENPEPGLKVTLYQGILKGDRFDYAIAKAVELGVYRLVPLICERTVVRLTADNAREKVARWQRLAVEAAKQCGRATIPEIALPQMLPQALALDSSNLKLIAYEQGGMKLKEVIKSSPAISVVVGPEGGLALSEIKEAERNGFIAVTLGKRILRAETAPLCLLSIIMYELGEL